VKKRSMSEIELKSISHSEYSLIYKGSFFLKLLGFILAIGSLILAYGIFRQLLTVPTYQYSEILNYVVLSLIMIIGLVLMFRIKKFLYFKVISGFNVLTELELKPTKYNELALKYLASKFY
jgi:cytochrome c biogenesis protein CcdA